MKPAVSILILLAALLLPALKAEAEYVVGIGCYGPEKCSFPMVEDIMGEIYRRAGIKIKIKYFPLLRDLRSANSGATDATAARSLEVLKNYPNLIPIPTPLLKAEFHMFFLAHNEPPVGWNSLRKLKVGIVRGTPSATANAQEHGIAATVVPSHKLGFEMLKHKRIDVLIAASLVGNIYAARLKDLIELDSRVLYRVNAYHMVYKAHHDLVPRLDNIIKEMHREDVIKKIVQKHQPGTHVSYPVQATAPISKPVRVN